MKRLRTLDDIPIDGKRVILRVDFNISTSEASAVGNGEDYRIQAALETIQELRRRGCIVLLLTHRGKPGDTLAKTDIRPIHQHLQDTLKEDIKLLPKLYGSEVESIVSGMEQGSVALFPNIRSDEREMKANERFASHLAEVADAYVNEAFSVSHRAQTSVAVLPRVLLSAAGRRTVVEVDVLSKLQSKPQRPYVAIVSGAKIVTKVGMLHQLLGQVDTLCVGGQIANVFLEARGDWKGGYNGNEIEAARSILATNGHKILLPEDVVIGNEDGSGAREVSVSAIPEDTKYIWDIGPKSAHAIVKVCKTANTIMWNGPVGKTEVDAYSLGTKALASAIADMSGYRVVGGGDTVNVLEKLRITSKYDHVSVGGGAMIAMIEGKFMPGLEPLYIEEKEHGQN